MTTAARPALSVLIDTYNHERYIEQAVVSAIEQDFPASEYEIVVVDDGSTDRTPEIVAKFAPRVRLLRKRNGGQASAFNAAVPELRGEIIALLDGDDWFAPGKLTAVATALEQNPEAGAVSHGFYEFHQETSERNLRVPERREFFSLATPETARLSTTYWPFLIIGALTVRRGVLQRIVPIPEVLVFCADGPIAWSAMASGTLVFQDALCYYRHHEANLHTVDAKSRERLRRKSEMLEVMFQQIEQMLPRIGVSKQAMLASFYPWWVVVRRQKLRSLGGDRLEAFRTEMLSFRSQYQNPSIAYRLFKYVTLGAAASLLSPRQFYALWEWYGRQKPMHFPDSLRIKG
ncbi:MAG TPA: glycosyltransferase family 2 protein [Candidatus Acidoferrum sp.]|nr:glycosyltransferase family 2 protein [Candidatus Acidoferrum sp.]